MKWDVDVSAPVNALGDLERSLPVSVERALQREAEKIQNTAQTKHRYTRRTGALMGATVAKATEMEIEGYIDESKAHYGKYVHEGHHSWAPDRFLTTAFEKASTTISRAVTTAISSAIKDVGLA